jgi:hypothetical protein
MARNQPIERIHEQMICAPLVDCLVDGITTMAFIGTNESPFVVNYDASTNHWSPTINKPLIFVPPQTLFDISLSSSESIVSQFHLTKTDDTVFIVRKLSEVSLPSKILNPVILQSDNKGFFIVYDQSVKLKPTKFYILVDTQFGWELNGFIQSSSELSQRGVVLLEHEPITLLSVGGTKETSQTSELVSRKYESQRSCHISVKGEIRIADLNVARSEPCVLKHNNMVYVLGGWQSNLSSSRTKFDPLFSIEVLDRDKPHAEWVLLPCDTPFHVFGPNGAIINNNSILLISSTKERTASLSLLNTNASWDLLAGFSSVTTLQFTESESFM